MYLVYFELLSPNNDDACQLSIDMYYYIMSMRLITCTADAM